MSKTTTTYAWICVPADLVSEAITTSVLGNPRPQYNFIEFPTVKETFENGALIDAIFQGLDIWHQLSKVDTPDKTLYAIKFLSEHTDGEFKFKSTASLLDIVGEAYRLVIDTEDELVAACRAHVLYGDESAASRLLTKEQMESCMENYLNILKSEKLLEVLDQHEHISTLDLFTSKFIWKPFTEKFLTNTVCTEPGAQADITEYSDFISEYIRRLSNSIIMFGPKEQTGKLKARVTLFGTSIAIPVYLDSTLQSTDTETVAKWIQGNIHAESDLLCNLAERNHKIAVLICIWSAIKMVIENDHFAYEECRLRLEVPIPSVLEWYSKYEPDEYASLIEYLKSDTDD